MTRSGRDRSPSWRAALPLLAAALLGGCALFRPAEAPPAPPPPPTVKLEVQAPGDLQRLLQTFLDLGRLGVLAPGEPVTEPELLRLIGTTPAQARSLLETEGYFDPEIVVERLPGSDPVTVRVTVRPGARTRVEDVRIEVRGPMAAHTEQQTPQALAAQRAIRTNWGLPTGAYFRNRDWTSAKNGALGQLRAQAYAAPRWEKTEARIDAEAHSAALEVVADSGPLFRTGELRVRGLQRQSERVVRNLAGFEPGTPATEQLLLDYQERLQASGLYDRVSVSIDDDPATADASPVTVRLGEQRLQQAVVGLGISANVGPRISLEHVHRRAFGRDATARNKIEWGKVRQAWDGELSSHPGPRFWRNLVGGTYERLESDTDVVTSARMRVGRTKDTRLIDRLVYVEVENGIRRTDTARQTTQALSLNYHGIWRKLDSVLLPTDGYSLALQLGGGQARSNFAPSGPFVRAYGRLTGYWPLGRNWYSSARVEAAQVFVRDGVVVPDSQRFRAGGDESVRGYEYRSLAPLAADGTLTSGNVLLTASAEVARPIVESIPALWGAVFVDAGRAAQRWSDYKPAFGFGVGARYRSPVGPLRVDLAWGEETRKLRLHLSVGVTF